MTSQIANKVPNTPPISVPIGADWIDCWSHLLPSHTQMPMLPAIENAMPENLRNEGDFRGAEGGLGAKRQGYKRGLNRIIIRLQQTDEHLTSSP